ncbi:Renalase [Varanus komodoensis]|nr:Renalase [Varanus komodoensis]
MRDPADLRTEPATTVVMIVLVLATRTTQILTPFLSLAESSDVGPSIVVHTSVSFGTRHLEWDKEKVQQLILNHLKDIIPHLPKPTSIKCQKWRYSQVHYHIEKTASPINQMLCCWSKQWIMQTSLTTYSLSNDMAVVILRDGAPALHGASLSPSHWEYVRYKDDDDDDDDDGEDDEDDDAEGPQFNAWLLQVTQPFPGSPGHIQLHTKPFLVCGGDGFVHSNFDGCIDSAMSVVEALRSSL